MNGLRKYFGAAIFMLILVASTGSAWATTAANTQIVNQAQLSYFDGAGTRTATAQVIVTVTLVPAVPGIAIVSGNQSTSYAGPATTLHNTFSVTNNSNGPDTFTLAANITSSTNTSGRTATVSNPLAPLQLNLGGSITVAGSTQTVILVPSDGTADSVVNGIKAGTTIVIGGEARTVSTVVDPGTSGTATITLASALTNPAPLAGVVVGERSNVTVDVVSGTITTPGTDITVLKTLTATSVNLGAATLTSSAITDTYTSGTATLAKFVRNFTTGAAGTGTKTTMHTVDYWPSGVTAKPGEVLEYLLVASASATSSVTQATVTDVLPLAFMSLKTGFYGGKDLQYEDESGVATNLTQANDGDAGKYVAGTGQITVYVGTGATNSAGGVIAPTKSIYVYYQTTVNP